MARRWRSASRSIRATRCSPVILRRGSTEGCGRLLERLGFELWHPACDQRHEAEGGLRLLDGLEEFRAHLGGELTDHAARGYRRRRRGARDGRSPHPSRRSNGSGRSRALMQLALPGEPHLTYCTNIHQGESWPEIEASLATSSSRGEGVASRPTRRWASACVSRARPRRRCGRTRRSMRLIAFLAAHDLYVFTINAFPYGPFHGRPVKEQVYEPDWRSPGAAPLHQSMRRYSGRAAARRPGRAASARCPGASRPR